MSKQMSKRVKDLMLARPRTTDMAAWLERNLRNHTATMAAETVFVRTGMATVADRVKIQSVSNRGSNGLVAMVKLRDGRYVECSLYDLRNVSVLTA